MRVAAAMVVVLSLLGSACTKTESTDGGVEDAGDGGLDAGADAGLDAGVDAGPDAGPDAGMDAGLDAGPDAGPDAGLDAGTDAGPDAGTCSPSQLFGQAALFPTAANGWYLAAGDLNGDGRPDLAVTHAGPWCTNSPFAYPADDRISILWSQPGGGYDAGVISVADGPAGVAIVDVDGGRGGLVVAHAGGAAGGCSVLSSTGHSVGFVPVVPDGTVGPEVLVDAGAGPYSLLLADLTGDGILDAVTVDIAGSQAAILPGLFDGGFGAAISYGAAFFSTDLAAGDFDGDGRQDLVVVENSLARIAVYLAQDGGLGTAQLTHVPVGAPFGIAVGDFDRNGTLDAAVTDASGTGEIQVMLGLGNGKFAAGSAYFIGVGTYPLSIAVADFNGDGWLDLVVAPNDGTAAVDVFLNLADGSGTFGPALPISMPVAITRVIAADLNGDRKPDIAGVGSQPGVGVLLNSCR